MSRKPKQSTYQPPYQPPAGEDPAIELVATGLRDWLAAQPWPINVCTVLALRRVAAELETRNRGNSPGARHVEGAYQRPEEPRRAHRRRQDPPGGAVSGPRSAPEHGMATKRPTDRQDAV